MQFDPDHVVGRPLTVVTEAKTKADGRTFAEPVAYTKTTTKFTIPTLMRGDWPEWIMRKLANRLDRPAVPTSANNTTTAMPEASNVVVTTAMAGTKNRIGW